MAKAAVTARPAKKAPRPKVKPEIVITAAEKAAAEAEIVDLSKKIDFYITEYSVEILAHKIRSGDFVVPPYQRDFTWEPERQSRFIESVLLGLQIPFLFFWEMEDGRLEVVDGSQRLRTLEAFVFGDLRLGELDQLAAVSGFKFTDLPESRRRKVLNRSIRGIVLNEHADEQARFDMFDRINTSSKAANKAEVRRGALAGPFMSLVIELAALPAFVTLAPVSDKLFKEREHEELVTRFFAYSDGLAGYKDRPAEFIFNYVKKTNAHFQADPSLASRYRRRFADMVTFVGRVFPHGFRRAAGGKATPRARFEAIAIGSYLALIEDPTLKTKRLAVENWLAQDEFAGITGSDGANAVGRLRDRMNFVKTKLLGQ